MSKNITVPDMYDMYKVAYLVNQGWKYDYGRCGWKKEGETHLVPKDQDGYKEHNVIIGDTMETPYWELDDAFNKIQEIENKENYLYQNGWEHQDSGWLPPLISKTSWDEKIYFIFR